MDYIDTIKAMENAELAAAIETLVSNFDDDDNLDETELFSYFEDLRKLAVEAATRLENVKSITQP